MNKIPCASQNTKTKALPSDVCIFGHFGQLSPACDNSVDCWFDSGVKWWIHVSSIVINLHKTSLRCVKTVANTLNRQCIIVFWSTVRKHGTHFEHSFLIGKCVRKMVNTLPSDIFNSSAISCNFNLWLAKTSL